LTWDPNNFVILTFTNYTEPIKSRENVGPTFGAWQYPRVGLISVQPVGSAGVEIIRCCFLLSHMKYMLMMTLFYRDTRHNKRTTFCSLVYIN